jgi:hypothetical protein
MTEIMRAMDASPVGLGRLKEMHTPQSVEAYFKILKAIELVYHWNKGNNLTLDTQGENAYSLTLQKGLLITT